MTGDEIKNIVEGLAARTNIVYRSCNMYKYSLLVSLVLSVISVIVVNIYFFADIGYPEAVHLSFTSLVLLVAVDIISLVFLAMWIIDTVELLEAFARTCIEVEVRGCNKISNKRSRILELADYPLWFIILYVVSVTFVTSAAYILMVLVKYGYQLGEPNIFHEGFIASSLLYTLGFILGGVASIVIVAALIRLGEHVDASVLVLAGIVFSTKYLVDLAALVYNISWFMSLLSLVLTFLSVRYASILLNNTKSMIRIVGGDEE